MACFHTQPASIFANTFFPPVTAELIDPHEICTECFERLACEISLGGKILHFLCFIHFCFNTLHRGLNLLLMKWKWLGLKTNVAELLTTDAGLYNGAEFEQSLGFILSMVKQLESS